MIEMFTQYQNNPTSSPGFSVNCPVFWQFCRRIDVIFHIIIANFSIWSTVAGYDELSVGF